MCKYCDGLKQMWKQYKRLDAECDVLCSTNCGTAADEIYDTMYDLLLEHALFTIDDPYCDFGDLYYFADGTAFNHTTGDYIKNAASFDYCPKCGKKLTKKRKK